MPVSMTAGGSTYYLTYNQVGSLRVVSDAADNVVKRLDYDSFGNIISDSNLSLKVPFGFAGGLHDRDTNLVRFGYRDYDPDVGIWTAKDPILFAGGDTDLYGYVLNDPVNLVDPEGLWYVDVGFNLPAFGPFGGISIDIQMGPCGNMLVPGLYIGTPGFSLMGVTDNPSAGFQQSISGGYWAGGSATSYGQHGPYSFGIGFSTPGGAVEIFQYGFSPSWLPGNKSPTR
ncbi:MAG: RHS repeat-associated core domain-containing protein [Pseudomonadota bacterium]